MTGKTVAALLDHAGIHYDGFVCSKSIIKAHQMYSVLRMC